ncbi:MAG TPA: hypothetical protein VHQ95_06355, partial [Pyrinomonadaceae bacterium]|nr:hypothetical protein [Pyrinomonadaceae bacterium]
PSGLKPIKEIIIVKKLTFSIVLVALSVVVGFAQQPNEQRAALNETVIALDAKSAPALEAHLLTQVLNGAEDSPVTNIKLSVKNTTANFYTYVSGWVTFYDANALRCGDGLFKIDALAPQESAEVDTPGLRLRCSPQSWRVVATNLMTRTVDIAKPFEPAPPVQAAVPERPAPMNFVISVDGQDYPIQVNNPMVVRLGNRNRRIVLRQVP